MRHSHVLALASLFAACAAATGCSSSPEDAPEDLGKRLEADTGVPWAMRIDEASGEVRFLSPARPVRIGEGGAEQAARAFFERYRAALHGTGSPDELRPLAPQTDDEGTTHIRFEHFLPGTQIPLLGSASTAHFTKDGEVYYLQPGFRAGLEKVSTTPELSEADAVRLAVEHVASNCGARTAAVVTNGAELAVRTDETMPLLLVWRVPTFVEAGACNVPQVLVDAATGEIAAVTEASESIWDVQAKGVHFHHMGNAKDIKGIDVTRKGSDFVLKSEGFSKVITQKYARNARGALAPLDITTTSLGRWVSSPDVQGAEVDAHFHAFHALDYFRTVHRRNGVDGNGGNLIILVHANDDQNDDGMNARHKGSDGLIFKDDYLWFGDGDFRAGKDTLPYSAAYDIVVHETAHAVTGHTSKLEYHHEPGALNESFSDVMAACAERRLEGGGDARSFILGERMTKSAKGLRSMLEPVVGHVSKMDPCHGVPSRANDYCGVHKNSGIPNRAFSLMTAGGRHSGVTVANGIGWDAAEKLWFRTLTAAQPRSTFKSVALAQVAEVARNTPQHLQAVACAWHAVGVIDPLGPAFSPVLSGVTCPAKASSCDGVMDGVVCNSQAPFAAFRCKNGVSAHSMMCNLAAGKARCRQVSPTDWTGSLGPDGYPVCD